MKIFRCRKCGEYPNIRVMESGVASDEVIFTPYCNCDSKWPSSYFLGALVEHWNDINAPRKDKPCPFCGSNMTSKEHGTLKGHWFKCLNCGASSDIYNSYEEAKTAWNRRPDDDAVTSPLT